MAYALNTKSPLTLRLRHSNLQGSDELMLTKRQIVKIQNSIANGTGTDIKISKTQISKTVKHGGNLFTTLASLRTRLLPYATSVISKAVSALWSLGIDIKLFGKGISIPKKFIPMLPPFKKQFTKAQINQINKAYQTGGRLVIKPTRKQIEGGFLGTLTSIEIPVAISLVSKMFGSGLQVDRQLQVIQEIFTFLVQWKQEVKDTIRIFHHLFMEVGKSSWSRVKKKNPQKRENGFF